MSLSGRYLFTSESVTEGHPDKVADAISDTVVDAILDADPNGRVACETLVTTGMALLAGEITTQVYVDIPKLVRGTIKSIGYTDAGYGFDYETCAVLVSIDEQSGDIAMGVDRESPEEQGAGDQGLMFGYATKENDAYMPTPIHLAHRMAQRLAEVRKDGKFPYLRPDGKTQVTIEYDGDQPVRVDTVVISTQHDDRAKLRSRSSRVPPRASTWRSSTRSSNGPPAPVVDADPTSSWSLSTIIAIARSGSAPTIASTAAQHDTRLSRRPLASSDSSAPSTAAGCTS